MYINRVSLSDVLMVSVEEGLSAVDTLTLLVLVLLECAMDSLTVEELEVSGGDSVLLSGALLLMLVVVT